jgi:hypothetical protein
VTRKLTEVTGTEVDEVMALQCHVPCVSEVVVVGGGGLVVTVVCSCHLVAFLHVGFPA